MPFSFEEKLMEAEGARHSLAEQVSGLTPPTTSIERLGELGDQDLSDLCLAAEYAIQEGGGFGWLEPPVRDVMEQYWRGIALVPTLSAWIARFDGTVVGSVQMRHMPKNNEAQAHSAQISSTFIAPWARGHGLARGLLSTAIEDAKAQGISLLTLDLRETQSAAITIFESRGFVCFGTNPYYAKVGDEYVAGRSYYLKLD